MPRPKQPTAVTEPRELNLLAASVEFEAAPADAEPQRQRRFQMVAYTGGPMILAGWRYPVVVDLNGLDVGKQRRPILLDHTRDVEFVMGQTDQITVAHQQLLVTGEVLGESPKAKQVIALNDKGFSWQASIGAKAQQVEFVPEGRTVEVNGRDVTGPVNVARRAALGEISFVVLGADENTTAQIAATAGAQEQESEMDWEQWIAAQGFETDKLTAPQRTSLEALWKRQAGTVPEAPVVTASSSNPTPQPPLDDVDQLRARWAAERRRIAKVTELCAGKHPELEARAIAEGWDETRTELELLRATRPKGPAIQTPESHPHTAQALEAALCLSAGLSEDRVGHWYDARTMEAALSRDLRGAGIHTLLYEVIRAAGGYARPGRVDNDTIRAAFVANDRLIQASEGFSTLGLAGMLSNVANKTMLAAYEAVNSVAEEICATTDVNDFKQVTRYRMTASGIFQKVGPDGELKHATLDEERYAQRDRVHRGRLGPSQERAREVCGHGFLDVRRPEPGSDARRSDGGRSQLRHCQDAPASRGQTWAAEAGQPQGLAASRRGVDRLANRSASHRHAHHAA